MARHRTPSASWTAAQAGLAAPREGPASANGDMVHLRSWGYPPAALANRIKGAAFRELIAWLHRELGPAEIARIVSELPDEHRAGLITGSPHLGVLAAAWYPAAMVHGFLDGLAKGRSAAEVSRLTSQGAVAALEVTLNGVHRAIIRVVGSPERHAQFAQRLWSAHYDDGVVVSARLDRHTQRIAYREWSSHHPLLCEITTASDLVIFPLMGLRGVRVEQLTCLARGDRECVHLVRWS